MGQNDSFSYKEVTVKPIFPNCDKLLDEELDKCNSRSAGREIFKHLEYPEAAIEEERSGTVYIEFMISEKGEIKSPVLLKSSTHRDLDVSALSAVKRLFKDQTIIPATYNNVPVKVSYQIPIKFQLDNSYQNDVKLSTEEILNKIEKLESPFLESKEAKSFSDNYVKFIKGIIIGFYLRDRIVIEDWEEFFELNNLNKPPSEHNLSVHDRIALVNLLEQINIIKKSIS